MSDPINPLHYKGNVEAIDALRSVLSPEQFRAFCQATAIAYLWRLGKKDSIEQDAAKAEWYISWLRGIDPRDKRKATEEPIKPESYR